MRRRIHECFTASNQADGASLRVPSSSFEHAIVTFEAVGVNGANLALSASEGGPSFSRNDGTALAAPNAGLSLVVGVGPGCAVGVPLPDELVLSMDAVGGFVNLRVDLFRSEETDAQVVDGRFMTLRSLLDRIDSRLVALVELLRFKR